MRAPTEMTEDHLREAHGVADMLLSEKFRSYLPGRLLAMLLGRFRDDLAETLGMPLPELPQRCAAVKAAKPGDLTSSELDAFSGAVLALVTRFTTLMNDPLLPKLLRDLQDSLTIATADRAGIADEMREGHGIMGRETDIEAGCRTSIPTRRSRLRPSLMARGSSWRSAGRRTGSRSPRTLSSAELPLDGHAT